MEKDTIVIDLDGTLANIAYRRHLVQQDKPDWDKFYAECRYDEVNFWCRELMAGMRQKGYEIVIVSARRKSCKADTVDWLRFNDIPYQTLYLLRNDNDHTEDKELKRNWLSFYDKDRVLFVVDDRQKVVDMWRSEGLVCLQCDKWEEKK